MLESDFMPSITILEKGESVEKSTYNFAALPGLDLVLDHYNLTVLLSTLCADNPYNAKQNYIDAIHFNNKVKAYVFKYPLDNTYELRIESADEFDDFEITYKSSIVRKLIDDINNLDETFFDGIIEDYEED